MTNQYHMLDYIYEGPESLRNTLTSIDLTVREIVEKVAEKGINKVVLSGVGSSFTACMMAWPLFQVYCPLPTLVVNSDEIEYYADRWIDAQSMVVVVSRSGERGSVVDAFELVDKKGALGVALTGVPDSLLAQKSKINLITREGPEITFPKTKSVITCTGALMKLGLVLAGSDDAEARKKSALLHEIPQIQKNFIEEIDEQLKGMLPEITGRKMINVVGSCSNYGTALEAAIKIQEASFIPTRGDSTSDLLVGAIGGLNADWVVYALVMKSDLALSKKLLKLTKNFNAYSVAVHPRSLNLEGLADREITTPEFDDPYLAALVYLPAVQLMAYYWTIERGMDPDTPSSMKSILDTILPPGRQEPELKG